MVKKAAFILVAIAAIVVGLLVGTLNSGLVQLDLLWVQLELPLGLVILLGFSIGVLTALSVIYLTRVLPLRLRLRKARSALLQSSSPDQQDTADLSLPDD